MLPPFPDNSRDYIQQMINMDGRPVTFYDAVSYSGCNLCSLDPISNTSTDSFCVQCSGLYWIPVYSGLELQAHVTYGRVDNKEWQTGGIVNDGTVTAKVMFSGWISDYIDGTDYVILDGRVYDIVDVDERGIPERNRILVRLKERQR